MWASGASVCVCNFRARDNPAERILLGPLSLSLPAKAPPPPPHASHAHTLLTSNAPVASERGERALSPHFALVGIKIHPSLSWCLTLGLVLILSGHLYDLFCLYIRRFAALATKLSNKVPLREQY